MLRREKKKAASKVRAFCLSYGFGLATVAAPLAFDSCLAAQARQTARQDDVVPSQRERAVAFCSVALAIGHGTGCFQHSWRGVAVAGVLG